MTRGRVCNLLVQFLLVFASEVTHGIQLSSTCDHNLLSRMGLSQPVGPGPRVCIPQQQDGPIITHDIGFNFHCL
jgi:hypothetical protein